VRLPCLGSLDSLLLLRAYLLGADGILVVGCSPGQCQHKWGNERAKRRVQMLGGLLETFGLGKDRIHFAWVYPSEISKLLETVNAFCERLAKLGPNPFSLQDPALLASDEFSWLNEFKKCDNCHQCREVCPLCFCKRCYPESFPNFGMGWLVHVIERCTVCGRCEHACPQGIRLFEVVGLLQQKISSLNLPPLNVSFSQERGKVGIVSLPK
jgi:heterodisulfide reductase subunit D